MKISLKKYSLLLCIAGLVVLIDRITKILVLNNLAPGEWWGPEWLMPYARLVYVKNTGVAFGMFQGMNVLFIILGIIVSMFILFYYPRLPEKEKAMRFTLGLLLGGSIGNLIDRILFGHVVDFVSVGNFAVFNVADSSITIGVVIMILAMLYQEFMSKRNIKPEVGEEKESS